ncbi:MAG: magnesium/cobalt transporter CorA [Synergistaceae bacterium]|nr:magnesium/cobalt transporter CorA [Synergistaceae bacterium]
MIFIGERQVDNARIDIIQYDAGTVKESRDVTPEECGDCLKTPGVTWINVNGIHNIGLIESLGKYFDLHPLTLEDIVNTTQRPKVEEFPNYVYAVLKMMTFDEGANRLDIEHVSLILGENYVISFQEHEGDVFDSVRERIRNAKGRIRSLKSDFLAYTLMDAAVDNYFLAVERIGDRIEEMDDNILVRPKPEDIQEVHQMKREILSFRKAVWPLREEVGALEKSETPLIRPETRVFLRDLYDHIIQIIDMVETFRDILGGIHDTYLSGVSNRMNEIMKVLTIISTIFIPMTFIAGVYGMNFQYMPELKWPGGYYLVWGIMLAIAFTLIVFFKRRKWF